MNDIEVDQRLRDLQKEYLDFLDDDDDQGIYSQLVKDMINNNDCRIVVNVNDLRKKNLKRCQSLLNNAFEELVAFQRALKEFASAADATYAKQFEEFFIGLEGSFGSKHVTPRTLTSRFLGNIVCVEGIVTKCSLVRPKVVRSVHYCPTTKKTVERRYADLTTYEAYPSSSVYPTKDEDGNLLETEFGLSTYKDHQTFSIQEMPEKAPAGQLPRTVDIVADNDLVDCCKPGDRVQIIGMYRCLPGKKGGYTSGTFRTILIANNVQLLSKEVSPHISADDVSKCKKFSKQKGDVFEILSKSLAPSIHGHEYIKKAVLCLLLGGVEKVLPNGTRLRGDINVLLLGDPSVAKSQLLRYVLHTAPRAIPTTGRGSSGVGLTAAVTTDQETGDRRLEAGAMVLADRGVVCIDEFDKMSDIDRTAIHEVMEQGRVTIAKAGIHAKLNARCSVLAAANPVYGKYDQYKTPMENIGLQDSLLSRFDLLFIMLDKMDPESDREISDHVVRMHRYRAPGEMDGEPLPIHSAADFLTTKDPNVEEEQEGNTPIYEKYDALLHGSRSKAEKIVSIQFMKKYIHIAKGLKPTLTKEACECIAEEYSRLRSMDTENTDMARTQPVTARSLETLIRLATAHSKARMSRSVDLQDAQAAIELVQFAYFKKVMEKPKKRRRNEDENSEDEADENKHPKKKPTKSSKPRPKPGEEGYDPYDFDDADTEMEDESSTVLSQDESHQLRTKETSKVPDTATDIPENRLKTFRTLVLKLFKERHAQSVPVAELIDFLAEQEQKEPFTPEEIHTALDKMMDANQVMVVFPSASDEMRERPLMHTKGHPLASYLAQAQDYADVLSQLATYTYVYILRTKHHIVGSLVGCFPRQTFQNSQMWLPLQLLQEESTLLVEKGSTTYGTAICKTVDDVLATVEHRSELKHEVHDECSTSVDGALLTTAISISFIFNIASDRNDIGIVQLVTSSKVGKITHPSNVEYFFKFRENLCMQQIDLHKEIRQKTILEKADIIYEGKKRKVLEKRQGKISKRKKKKIKANESCKQSMDHNFHGSVNAKSHHKCNKTNESSDEIITDEENFCVITNLVFSTNDEHSSNANQICPEGLAEGDTEKNYKIKSSDKCENSLEVVKESEEISEIENALVANKNHNSNVKVTNFGETQRVNQTININEKNIHGIKSNLLNQDSCYETGHSNECITIDKEVYVVKSITMHTDNDEDMNKNDDITRKLYKHSDEILEIGKEIDENLQTDENIILQPCSSTFIDIPEIDRDAIIAEEMMKIQNLKKETCMVQLFTECPWKTEEDDKIALWNYPHTAQEKLRYAVFKDLWEKGYYLTAGTKFGGDFLAYAGDPVKYHALYIIVCIPFKHNFQAIDLVVLGRLGNQVKKTVSLASMTPGGTVEYISLKWASETS